MQKSFKIFLRSKVNFGNLFFFGSKKVKGYNAKVFAALSKKRQVYNGWEVNGGRLKEK